MGRGVSQDHAEAASWYRKAARQGLARAQYLLGHARETGKGVPKDDKRAARWYRRAAEGGHPRARFLIAERYLLGQGVARDDVRAFVWFSLAADDGFQGAAAMRAAVARRLSEAERARVEETLAERRATRDSQ
jgi:TPR repeat protein